MNTPKNIQTSPLKRSSKSRKPPSTASTAQSDAFNAPIPQDEEGTADVSYTDLFKKYRSHVQARAHLNKIQHAINERNARLFEKHSQDYSTQQDRRVTTRHAKSHGEMSKDEGAYRIPMQPRVSPVKRKRAMEMGTRVLQPGELLVVPNTPTFDNNKLTNPGMAQRERRKRERLKRTKGTKKSDRPTLKNMKEHNQQHVGTDAHTPEQHPRAPFMDEALEAYHFHLNRHSERRNRRRTDRSKKKVSRSRSSLAREWQRGRNKEVAQKRKRVKEQRMQKLLDQGIHLDEIPEHYNDGKDDPDGWLEYKTPLQLAPIERQYLHQSFDPESDGILDVSSQRLTRISSGVGKSTLQLQLGAQVTRSLTYSANNFHGKEVPVSHILAMTFNQKQRSARQMRRARKERKNTSGLMERLSMAQCGLIRVPEAIGQLRGLQVLDLHSNQLTELPDELVQLHSLRVLLLHANRIEKLPACFDQLKNLTELDVSQNVIAYLPDGIHKCKKLKHVRYNANKVMVMGVFPVPSFADPKIGPYEPDDVWEKVDGLWWGCVYKNTRTGVMKRKPPRNAIVVDRVLNMKEAKSWRGELTDVPSSTKKRDRTMDFNALQQAGAPMSMLRLALRNSNSSEWEVGIDTNGDTYYESCLIDPGLYGQFLNRQYDMPPEMDRIGRLESMQVLQMSLNGVRTIPDSLGSGKLQYVLRELHLEFNKIRDLPNTMCNLVKLEKLYLGNNLIEKLPANIGSCRNLKVLRLQFNRIECLPASIGQASLLEILWLNNNKLTDLPNDLGHCSMLDDLKARNNSVEMDKRFNWSEGTKSIQYELRRRESIEISGAPPPVELIGIGVGEEVLIPKQRHTNIIIERCSEVANFAGGSTDVTKELRKRQRQKEQILKQKNRHRKKGEEKQMKEEDDEFINQTINLNWMGLTTIPPEIYRLEKKLRILRLVGNKITSLPPETLAPLGGLLKLNLNANNIDFLPDVFGKMRFLQELHLAENKLIEIPHSVMRLKNLTVLNFAHNKLVTVSKSIGRLRGITNINLASNILEEIPKEIGEATTLRKIDLSSNCIRYMPDETGNLFRLRKLNLNFNKLTKIPETFSQLSSLKMLLLCRNRIRELPKSLGAVVDVAAEYEKLADKSNDKTNKGQEIEIHQNLSGEGGSSVFAEQFISKEFENWRKWNDLAATAATKPKKGSKEGEQDGKNTIKSNDKPSQKRKLKADAISPYMLLTGIVSSAVKEGTPVIQKQKLWVDTSLGSPPGSGGASGTESEAEGKSSGGEQGKLLVGDKYQYAKGIVCEIISSSSIVVRVTTIGRKHLSSVLFIPETMLCTNYPGKTSKSRSDLDNQDENTDLGNPKTATQHQHLVLTFTPQPDTEAKKAKKAKKKKQNKNQAIDNGDGGDDEDDEDDEDGGYIGRFLLRLNRSAWLQQKETGAVGKVLASMCLTKLPNLPEMVEEPIDTDTQEKEKDTEEKKIKKQTKKAVDPFQFQPEPPNKTEEEKKIVVNDEDVGMKKQVMVTVVVLLLSKEGMFNSNDILTVYSDVPLPDIPDDESVDGEFAAARHLIQPPTHVSSRVREMMVTGPFKVESEQSEEILDELERGRTLMQMSPLKHAPPTVGILSMAPQFWPDLDTQTPGKIMELEERGTTKEHKAKLKKLRQDRAKEEAKLRRMPLLMVTGRPAKALNIYLCNEERPLIQSIENKPIGIPIDVEKQKVALDPSRWAKLAGKVGALALMAGEQLKKGAIKLLEKAVGPERALEIEEKTAKRVDVAYARALLIRQSAIERSIAMRHGIGPWAARMAKASASIRKSMRNRLIETVTGKFQLDDVSEDSDTPKEAATYGFGEEGDALKKTYKSDWKGMLVGGIKGLNKHEVRDLMRMELEEHEQVIESKRLQDEKDIKLGRTKKKKKKKKKKNDAPTPMITKPSLLANSLVVLRLSANRLTEVPETFSYFNVLQNFSVDQNPILSPPSLLANMGISHIRAYFALRTLRMNQLKNEFESRNLSYHQDRISPHANGVIAKESRGHLTRSDLKAFDAQVNKLINGQIVLFRYSAKKIVKNLIRVAAKRQHWYNQKILLDFVQLCNVVELETLAFENGFLSKNQMRPWGDGGVDVRVCIVALDELFDKKRGNPVSIVKMINQRKKLGYDKVDFKWKLRELEEAVMEYKGIWKNGLPIAELVNYKFEDAVPNRDDKIYSKTLKRMVPRKALGGIKHSIVIKRVIYTDADVKRKQNEDLEIKRFYEPKLYRLLQWFDTDKGQERIHAKIYEQKTTLREEQSKAQSKAEEANTHLNKAKKSYFQMRKRKEAFDEGMDIQHHRFKDEKEAKTKFDKEKEMMGIAKIKFDKFVAKVDHLRMMVARKPHEWEEWSENEFKTYVETKVRNEVVMRRRKIANIQGWTRPWDGFEGKDYEEWRTGKGCQWHPKFLDEIEKTASDEDSSFSVGEDPHTVKEGEGEKKQQRGN